MNLFKKKEKKEMTIDPRIEYKQVDRIKPDRIKPERKQVSRIQPKRIKP